MADASLIASMSGWLENNVFSSAPLAAVGFAALIGVLTTVLVWIVRFLAHGVRASGAASNASVRRAGSLPGYRVLVGDIDGPGGHEAGRAISQALETHLSEFCFGATFQLFRVMTPEGRPEGKMLKRARKRLEKTGADIIIWGERSGPDAEGLRIYGVSRSGSQLASEASPFTLHLPGTFASTDSLLSRAAAYLLAKRIQPALGRPEAFRTERMAELGAILDELLAQDDEIRGPHAPVGLMAPAMRREFEQDFGAITMYLDGAPQQPEWLENVITRRRNTLEHLKGEPDGDALIEARLDLGQALLKRAETHFDPVAVREATVHLNSVVDSLRGSDVIRKVQRASDGLQRAQGMVETRRRFAVNFSA